MQRYLGKRKELKIYIDSDDTYEGKPLYEALLTLAKKQGIAGATVIKAVAGMGVHSQMHSFSVWVLNQQLPLIVAIIDTQEHIEPFLKAAEPLIKEGLVTMNDIEVVQYHHPKFEKA